MKVRVRITDTDKGYKALRARLSGQKGMRVGVGLHADTGATTHPNGNGETFLQIAEENEFGLGNVPERPFVRQWFDQHVFDHTLLLRRLAANLITGEEKASFPEALKRLGKTLQGSMQDYIRSNGSFKPNAPYTIKKKGFNHPLIEFGFLVERLLARLSRDKGKTFES